MTIDRSHFRDPSWYAAARLSEFAAPALRLGAKSLARGPSTPPELWRKGLILGNGHIGDVLYRTCSLAHLANGLPECRWTYVTSRAGAEALADNPDLHEILPWTDDADRLAGDRLAALRERNADVALCSDNVAHHRALITAVRLGIPNRIAFTRKGLSGFATIGIRPVGQVPHARAFRMMVEKVTGVRDSSPLQPRIFPSPDDYSAATAELARLGLSSYSTTIACAVTTRQLVGPCPPAFFEDVLLRALRVSPDIRIVLTGVGTDQPLLEAIAARLGERVVVSAGRLGILAFGAMLGMCSSFLGTDSGARHLANASGIPVFFVRNLGTTAIETGAYAPNETDIAPAGEYLDAEQTTRALATVDRESIAGRLVASAIERASDRRAGSLRGTLPE